MKPLEYSDDFGASCAKGLIPKINKSNRHKTSNLKVLIKNHCCPVECKKVPSWKPSVFNFYWSNPAVAH
jgi:hypothetical protein